MTVSNIPIGCEQAELDTPALCLDLDRMEANIRTMVETCRRHGIEWRPHAKCHKSPVIASWLVAAGALGVTCATIDEAEWMASGGVFDLLIANMIAGPRKIQRLVSLAERADPIVCVDHIEQAVAISQAMDRAKISVRVVIELDIGMNRVGILPGEPALQLAKQVLDLPGIQLAGLMAYEGHLLTVADPTEKEQSIRRALALAVDTRRLLEHNGITCRIMSCGGTGSYPITVAQPGITELQAGGAIFMDAFYRHQCHISELDHALTVISTVVSRPAPDRAVIDAGRKSMNMEIHMPQVMGRDGVTIASLSAEHGVLQLDAAADDLRIGEQIEIIPGYADLTTTLHEHFWGFRDGRLERIIPISRRTGNL